LPSARCGTHAAPAPAPIRVSVQLTHGETRILRGSHACHSAPDRINTDDFEVWEVGACTSMHAPHTIPSNGEGGSDLSGKIRLHPPWPLEESPLEGLLGVYGEGCPRPTVVTCDDVPYQEMKSHCCLDNCCVWRLHPRPRPAHEWQIIMTRSKCFRPYNALWFSSTVTVLFILLASTGCSLSSAGAPRPTPPPTPTGAVPQFGHVVLIVEENSSYSEVIGSSEMPYLNSLATRYGLATQYFANTHPSIGNYFMLTTGQIVTNDDSFAGRVDVDNIVRELLASGKSWKSYAESRNDPSLCQAA